MPVPFKSLPALKVPLLSLVATGPCVGWRYCANVPLGICDDPDCLVDGMCHADPACGPVCAWRKIVRAVDEKQPGDD